MRVHWFQNMHMSCARCAIVGMDGSWIIYPSQLSLLEVQLRSGSQTVIDVLVNTLHVSKEIDSLNAISLPIEKLLNIFMNHNSRRVSNPECNFVQSKIQLEQNELMKKDTLSFTKRKILNFNFF